VALTGGAQDTERMLRSRLANLLLAIAVGLTFLAGLFISGLLGGTLLLAVAVFLGILSASSWSAIPTRGQPVRVLIVAVVLLIAIFKLATS
jgi:hypothetical protein